ncbi:response regulator transcription factor, partial [Streptomyces sp. NPDC060027]|uniref:response regulator transcription factor n=1 Tax=Streptomyces sp. NPDC060027 TaxID=3347040 RepID=UPI0036872939
AAEHQAYLSLQHCEEARTPLLATTQTSVPLTPREREIALLAANGTASKDIAEALQVSARTIDNHLQHIYQKLGITKRSELAQILKKF